MCTALRRGSHSGTLQGNTIDNEAVLQLQVSKGQNQFLSTLAKDGAAQFLTVLKPCGILLPHVHQRGNEFYSVVFGASSFSVPPAAVGWLREHLALSIFASGPF